MPLNISQRPLTPTAEFRPVELRPAPGAQPPTERAKEKLLAIQCMATDSYCLEESKKFMELAPQNSEVPPPTHVPLRSYSIEGPGLIHRAYLDSSGIGELPITQLPGTNDDDRIYEFREQRTQVRDEALRRESPYRSSRVVPDDLTLRPASYAMAVRGERTALARQMAEIGQHEGFQVTLDAEREDMWTRDQGERTITGGYNIPAPPGMSMYALHAAIVDGREERKIDPLSMDVQGQAFEFDTWFQRVDAALVEGASVRVNLTSTEGGDVLKGSLPSGEGYALLGNDSVLSAGVRTGA